MLVLLLAGGCAPLGEAREALVEAEPGEGEALDDEHRVTQVVDDRSTLTERDALLLALLDQPDRAPEDRPRVSVRTSQRLVHAVRGMHYPGTLSDWLDDFGSLVGITDRTRQLRPAEHCRDNFECFEQVASDGLPVFGGYVQGRTNESGELELVLATVGLETPPPEDHLTAEEALRLADASAMASGEPNIDLGYTISDGVAVLSWAVTYPTGRVLVDAEIGELAGEESFIQHLDAREIYRAVSGQAPVQDPMTNLWTNYTQVWRNTPSFTPAAPYWMGSWPGTSSLIHTYVGNTNNFFSAQWSRDGWDDDPASGLHRMRAAADFDFTPLGTTDPRDAFWVGPGWGPPYEASAHFGANAACRDVVAHEFFHGVQHDEIGTMGDTSSYSQQRAIYEGLSDAFGRFVERQYGTSPDWVVGTGGSCTGRRSMSDPEAPASGSGGSCSSCDFGASHYSNYQRWDTNGGNTGDAPSFRYANATILDRAVFLMGRDSSAGPTTFAGRTVTGIGNLDASLLVYDLVRDRLAYDDSLYDLADGWIDAAALRFGSSSSNFANATSAIHAVGLWYGGYLEPDIGSQSRSSFAPFTVSGQARTYVAYRGNGVNDLRVRYRSGTLSGSIWSSATSIGSTSSGPALQPHGGVLWAAYRNAATNVVTTRTLTSSGAWTAATALPGAVTTDSDVAMADFGGNLYVFYRSAGTGSRPIHYMVRSGGAWFGPSTTGASSDAGPAAAVVGNRLYVVYRRGTTSLNMFYRYLETSLFSDELNIPRQTTQHFTTAPAEGTPTAIGYRGRLHVASRSTDGTSRYSSYCYCAASPCACTYRVGEWTQTVRLQQQVSTGPPVLYTDAGGASPWSDPLYLVYPSGAHAYRDLKISE